jgi:hypothetical protein
MSDIGVDLLINPNKRGGGGSNNSLDSGSEREAVVRASSEPPPPPASVVDWDISAADDVVSIMNDHLSELESSPPLFQQHPATATSHPFAAAAAAGSGGRGNTTNRPAPEAHVGSGGFHCPPFAVGEEDDLKRELLYKFDRLEKRGVQLPRRFGMHSSYDEMKREFDRIERDRECDASVRFQRKMLMAMVTGVEFLNNRFDPFDIQLDGWSETVQESLHDYDDVFEALHEKYHNKAHVPPEIKLIMMVGGSAFMFHLSNTMFKSSMPGLQDVLRQNPDLMKQFASATMNTMAHQNVPGARSFGSMMFGGAGAAGGPSSDHGNSGAQPQHHTPYPLSHHSPPVLDPRSVNQTMFPPNPVGVSFQTAPHQPQQSPMKGPDDWGSPVVPMNQSTAQPPQQQVPEITIHEDVALASTLHADDDDSVMADLLLSDTAPSRSGTTTTTTRAKGSRSKATGTKRTTITI